MSNAVETVSIVKHPDDGYQMRCALQMHKLWEELALSVPVLAIDAIGSTDYIDRVRVTDMPAPVMVGIDTSGRKFISVRLSLRKQDGGDHGDEWREWEDAVMTFFQRYSNQPDPWVLGASGEVSALVRCTCYPDFNNIKKLLTGVTLAGVDCWDTAEEVRLK